METKEKLLKRYVILENTSKTSAWMALGVIALWFILTMIGGIFHVKSINIVALIATIVLFLGCVIYSLIASFILHKAPQDPAWQKIEADIKKVFIDRYGDEDGDDEVSLVDIANAQKKFDLLNHSFMDKVHDAMEIYDIKTASPKRYVLAFILMPCIILVLSFVPSYIKAYSFQRQSAAAISEIIADLNAQFVDDAYYISYDDPKEEYQEYGYYFSAYLDYDMDSYINVTIDNDGMVDYLAYSVDVDPTLANDEKISFIESQLARYYVHLKDATIDEKFKKDPVLTEAFKEALNNHTDDQRIDISSNGGYISYHDYDYGYGRQANFYYSISDYD